MVKSFKIGGEMKKIIILLSTIILVPYLFAYELYKPAGLEKIEKNLGLHMGRMSENDEVNIWVFFTDKGFFTENKYEENIAKFRNHLSARRRKRREKMIGKNIADFSDLGVVKDYVQRIVETGAKKRKISNWLNAASFTATKQELEEIEYMPFVRKMKMVETFYLEPEVDKQKGVKKMQKEEGFEFHYGSSKSQNSLIGIDEAHNHGYFGEGVRIGMLDDGFIMDTTKFEAFSHVSRNIIDTWDFINDTSYVGRQLGEDADQCKHGTSMLSIIAGFKDNELIGPAFNAEFALAKTEQRGAEIKQEEDNWVAGAEWADSCGSDKGGVDIISSSLGYKFFDDTIGYSYEDMNGDSTVITRAADLAASKGIVVVTAMGNISSGFGTQTARPGTCIVAPADADSIISVGAVDSNYTSGKWEWAWVWIDSVGYGAAIGPTADGRIKPEVCASWGGYHINPDYDPEAPDTAEEQPYYTGFGTSVSTALIAGGCALILQAHPDWSAMKVRDVLLQTASQSSSPDTLLGWGIADIWDAMNNEPLIPPAFEEDELSPPYPNPFNLQNQSQVVIPYNIMNQGLGGRIFIYTVSGKKIREIDLGSLLVPGRYETPAEGAATWDGKDSNGEFVDAGIYLVLLRTGYTSSTRKIAVVR